MIRYDEERRHSDIHYPGFVAAQQVTESIPSSLPPLPPQIPAGLPPPPTFNFHQNHQPVANYGMLATQRQLPPLPPPIDLPRPLPIDLPAPVSPMGANDEESQAMRARSKALAILQKFEEKKQQQEQEWTEQAQEARKKALDILASFDGTQAGITDEILDPYKSERVEWARRRAESLDRLQARKEKALLKNFEYLQKVEAERLQESLQHLEKTQIYQQQLKEYHQRVFAERRRAKAATVQVTTAGLGSKERKKAENQRKKQIRPGTLATDSVAIYVSNLKPADTVESYLRTLFGAYGKLHKIHFYKDKKTGKRKGDVLVIYNLEQPRDRATLTESVCLQVGSYRSTWL